MKKWICASILAISSLTSTSSAMAEDTCKAEITPICLEAEMLNLFNSTDNPKGRDDIGTELVSYFAGFGKIEPALKIAAKLSDSYSRQSAYSSIIQQLSNVGKTSEATKILKDNIPSPNDRLYPLQNISDALIKADKIDEAVELAGLLGETEPLDNYYQNLANSLSYQSRYKQAYDVASLITLAPKKASTLRAIAIQQMNAGF